MQGGEISSLNLGVEKLLGPAANLFSIVIDLKRGSGSASLFKEIISRIFRGLMQLASSPARDFTAVLINKFVGKTTEDTQK